MDTRAYFDRTSAFRGSLSKWSKNLRQRYRSEFGQWTTLRTTDACCPLRTQIDFRPATDGDSEFGLAAQKLRQSLTLNLIGDL
jgi:hypothetical protein